MSGAILALLSGTARDTVTVTGQDITSVVAAPATATAGLRLNASGVAESNINGAYTTLFSWVIPNGAASNYECYATLNSGTLTSGTTGSWLALTSSRLWTVSATSTTKAATITVEVRRVSTTTTLASGSFPLSAESS